MDAKTKIIIKAVVIPLGFLILILTILLLFIVRCRMDRKKDEREGLNHSFSSGQWQTTQPPQYQHQYQYQYPESVPQMQKPAPVVYPVQYQSPVDTKGQV